METTNSMTSQFSYQVKRVENLQFSDCGMSRISQVAVIGICGKCAHSALVWRRFPDCVQNFHVTDVMDEQRLL